MKLGYLCHPRIFQTGGPGGRTAGLLAAIAELGHEVHVRSDAVPHGLDVVTHRADTDGLECMAEAIDLCLVRLDGSCHAERLADEMHARHPDLPVVLEVHAPLEEQLTYPTSGEQERRLRREWIVRGNAIRRRLVSAGAGVICVSEGMEQYARQALGARRALVCPNAADPQRFAAHAPPAGKFTALWTGSARYAWQAADLAIESALRAPETTFILACPQRDGLPGELPPNVQPVFGTRPEEMHALYCRAHAVLVLYHPIPDSQWGFYLSPLKLYEALAAGLPVVGSRLGQIAQVLDSANCGYVVDNKPQVIADALDRLANDPDQAAQMGASARRQAQARTWSDVAASVMSFCQETVAKAVPSR